METATATAAKTWYAINRADEAGDEAEVSIYDLIGSYGITASQFIGELKSLTAKTIHVHINSMGGSVFDGVAIASVLKGARARVVTHIDGIAASIASIVAIAGDEVRIAGNGFLMIHNPMMAGGITADSGELRKMADTLDKMRDQLAGTYAEKTKRPKKEMADLMDAETWLTAAEAKELGFVDAIVGEIKAAAVLDLSGFNNVPAPVMQAWGAPPKQETAPEASPRGDAPPVLHKETSTMENPTQAPAPTPAAGNSASPQGETQPQREATVAELRAMTSAGYIEQGRKVGAEQAHQKDLELLNELVAACPGKPQMAIEAFRNGLSVAAVKLAFDAESRADARALEAAKEKDKQIARLEAIIANGGHPGAAMELAGVEDEQPKLDPKAQAEWEWENKPSVRKTARNKEIYVLARTAELEGTHRSFAREPVEIG